MKMSRNLTRLIDLKYKKDKNKNEMSKSDLVELIDKLC